MREAELTQMLSCPACGWQNTAMDIAQGLSSAERQCRNHQCRTYFLAVWRHQDLVGTTPLPGHDIESFRAALQEVDGLEEHEREILVQQAIQRVDPVMRNKVCG